MDNLDEMFKPNGIKCPKCKSKNLKEFDEPDYEMSDDELWLGPDFLFTCEDCGHHFR